MSKLRVELSPYMDRLVREVSELTGRSLADTLDSLHFRIEMLGRHRRLGEFGLEWSDAAERLYREFGIQEDGIPAKGDHVPFDVELLERDAKTKAGFAGVYVASGGFRALVPDEGGARYTPTRKTALEAAIDRFRWFEERGIPYGSLARNVEHWRKMRPQQSTEEILIGLVEDARAGGTMELKHPYTLAEAEAALASHRARNGIKPLVAAPRAEVASNNEALHCSICEQPIEHDYEVSIFGKTPGRFSHKSCAANPGAE